MAPPLISCAPLPLGTRSCLYSCFNDAPLLELSQIISQTVDRLGKSVPYHLENYPSASVPGDPISNVQWS